MRLLSGRWLLIGLLLLATAGYALAETMTLTTYYPSPRGVYNELKTMGQTILAQNGGNVGIGTATPSQKLDVAGNVIAPLYYDKNNTGYYLDPNNTSRLNFGDFDNLHAYGTLDANAFTITPFIYDKDNTAYFLDPNNWSSLNFLLLSNYINTTDVWLRNAGRWASQIPPGPNCFSVGGCCNVSCPAGTVMTAVNFGDQCGSPCRFPGAVRCCGF